MTAQSCHQGIKSLNHKSPKKKKKKSFFERQPKKVPPYRASFVWPLNQTMCSSTGGPAPPGGPAPAWWWRLQCLPQPHGSETWLYFVCIFFFFCISGERSQGGLTRNTTCSESPGAEMAGEMSTGMMRSTFLAKQLPRAMPWSSSLVGLDNASVPWRPQRYPQRGWGTAQWEAFMSPHGTPRCTQK